MTQRSMDQRRTRLPRIVAVVIGAVALLGACTSDGTPPGGADPGDIEAPAPAPEPEAPAPAPEPEAPAPEPEAPEPAPEPSPPSTDQPAEDGLTSEEWLILILLGVAGLAIVMGIVALATNHSEKKKAAQSLQNRRVGELVGLGRWVHDQGSVEVLRATEAHQLQTVWLSLRARSIDLETRAAALAGATDDRETRETIMQLATNVAGLRGALETNVSIRLDQNAAANTALIDDTTRSVYQRRQDVHMDLTRLSAMRA